MERIIRMLNVIENFAVSNSLHRLLPVFITIRIPYFSGS